MRVLRGAVVRSDDDVRAALLNEEQRRCVLPAGAPAGCGEQQYRRPSPAAAQASPRHAVGEDVDSDERADEGGDDRAHSDFYNRLGKWC